MSSQYTPQRANVTSETNDEKIRLYTAADHDNAASAKSDPVVTLEVFRQTEDGVQFRTVQFAMSILSVPGALTTLGAVGGALSIVGWQTLNTYTAVILGEFRSRHPECHTLADMCGRLWGRAGKELVGLQILVAQVLISAAGIVSISTAFNAVSDHEACTVIFTLVSTILITAFSSVHTFSRLGWLTWIGFFTFFVVTVTQQDRPVMAPQTGDFDLVLAMYLSFSLVIYRWCGVWLATPAFGSAGPLFKKLSYGIALPGLIIGVGIYQHVAAKYVFVHILRDSYHLQENTTIHWATRVGTNLVLGILAFIVAEAVPILNYLLGLAGAVCFAPFSLLFPDLLWMQDFGSYRKGSIWNKAAYYLHILLALVGLFMVVAGTYSVVVSIRDAYQSGLITKVFNCADNSRTIS